MSVNDLCSFWVPMRFSIELLVALNKEPMEGSLCGKRSTGKASWKHAIFPDPVFLKSDNYYNKMIEFNKI